MGVASLAAPKRTLYIFCFVCVFLFGHILIGVFQGFPGAKVMKFLRYWRTFRHWRRGRREMVEFYLFFFFGVLEEKTYEQKS